jgi:glycosyltransferase involved in cell wall biosynthesis
VLSGLDIIVLTSLNEGTPVSIMEAMAASRPVVATSVGGIQELLTNGETGYAYDKAAELKNVLLKLIENPDLRKKIGTEARMFAQQNLSIDNQVNELKKIYLQAKSHNK